MANELLNATFLDDVNDWSGPNLAVASTGIGGRGRLVLTSTGTVRSTPRPLNGRTGVWGVVRFLGVGAGVRFLDAGGGTVQDVALPTERQATSQASRGRVGGFKLAKGYVAAPGGATQFALYVTGPDARLTKPYASADGLKPCIWQSGPHTNLDLNYPSWPAHLPAIMDEGLQFDPIPTRKGFSGDAGVEATRRITRSRRYQMSAQVDLTTAQRDDLMDFFDEDPGKFWFTRPDTREVCLAQWMADGEPVDAGQLPGRRRTQFKLQLMVP